MKIFLTGGNGMVGQNFREHAAAAGHEIIAPSSSELDLRDFFAVENFLRYSIPDFIVHTAGRVGGIQANIKAPVEFLLGNLDIGRNIVLAARNAGVKNLLNLGSSCMYPRNAINPLQEDSILQGELEPTNEGYALAKIAVARLCEYIVRENNEFQYKTLLPCNIFGRFDKFDPAHSHLVPAIIHKLHIAKTNGVQEVDIWGSGHARREFMYAGDLADCMWTAVERFDTMPQYMNAGLGADLSVNEYYQSVARVVGYQGDFIHDLSKPEGMKQKTVSIQKLKEWGWSSTTSLDAGIRKTYQFYLTNCTK